MKSPFPGMDPYLEPHWLDVHTRLTTYAADALNEKLPQDLIASTEERIAVESEDGIEQAFKPDVQIREEPAPVPTLVEEPSSGMIAAPFRLVAQVEPTTERFVRIIEAGTERLITVIEIVSPTNKRSPGLEVFRAKRRELLRSGVNFVEVDLVRAGDAAAMLMPIRVPEKAITPYRVTFRLPRDPLAVYLHPVRLQDRLPAIPIPLRTHDPEVRLDLQTLVDQAYGRGRYHQRINYATPCDPPLGDDDALWADHLLKGTGKR